MTNADPRCCFLGLLDLRVVGGAEQPRRTGAMGFSHRPLQYDHREAPWAYYDHRLAP